MTQIISTLLRIGLITFAVTAQASETTEYPIDDRQKSLELKIQENVTLCIERSPGSRAINCEAIERQRLERECPFRGTRQYVRQYYLPLETQELLKVRDELKKQQPLARSQRDFWVDAPRPAGELTKEVIGAELGQIATELEQRKRKGQNAFRNMERDLKRVLN